MATYKKLTVGSMLFNYHEPVYQYAHYHPRSNSPDRKKYSIAFKVLYIYNRRERSYGAAVPTKMIPLLKKFSIKYVRSRSQDSSAVDAVGCRHYTYYKIESDFPYPTAAQIQEAKERFDSLGENATHNGIHLSANSFFDTYIQNKLTNKDALYVLKKPIKES